MQQCQKSSKEIEEINEIKKSEGDSSKVDDTKNDTVSRIVTNKKETCLDSIDWHPGVMVHDLHPHVDMMNVANLTVAECGQKCCDIEGCVAFVNIQSQLS